LYAYDAEYVTRDGRLVIDEPEVRRRLIKAVDSYTAVHRKGCTPPDSATWDAYSNNERVLAQTIVMTPNQTLSIPNALKRDGPDDYYKNAVTIDLPDGAYGQPLVIETSVNRAAVFTDGSRPRRSRALSGRRGLARALSRRRGRPHAAADAEAASGAVLARPGRPASHAFGHAASDSAAPLRLRGRFGRLAAQRGVFCLAGGHPAHRHRRHQPRAGVDEAIAHIKQILAE
jgi:hypothetical protein